MPDEVLLLNNTSNSAISFYLKFKAAKMRTPVLIISFLSIFSFSSTAQEKIRIKCIGHAKVGVNQGLRNNFYLDHKSYKNRDFKLSLDGGVYFLKNSVVGAGFRFDRIQLNRFSEDAKNVVGKYRVHAFGPLIYVQQNFHLRNRTPRNKRTGGFIKAAVSSLRFAEQKVIKEDPAMTVQFEDFGRNDLFLSGSLGISHHINEETAFILQGTIERNLDANILGFSSSSGVSLNLLRKSISFYMIEVGVRKSFILNI